MAKLRKNPPPYIASVSSPISASSNILQRSPSSATYISRTPTQSSTSPSTSSTMSRTMAHARAQMNTDSYQLVSKTAAVSVSCSNAMNRSGDSFTASLIPQTLNEQYWAVRALVAEVRLAEREENRADASERARSEERRRQLAVDSAHKFHEDRIARLERLIIGLISTIVFISIILLFRQHKQAEEKAAKSSFRPHLTIPILSPFTSIVENEVSKVNFRTTAVFIIILGILAYALIRHWLHRRQR